MLFFLLLTIISKCYLVFADNPLACVLYKDKNCATYKYEPSCGNNGITYSNVCFFSKEECMHPSLFIVHKGECDPATTAEPTTHAIETYGCRIYKNFDCTKEAVKKSCGNDGVTYDNACSFGQKECTNPNLQVDHDGPCTTKVPSTVVNEPFGCRIYKNQDCSVKAERNTCGNDGVTYLNACYFGQAECSNPSLKINNLGSCLTTTVPTMTVITTSLPTTLSTTTERATLSTTTETPTIPTTTETQTLPTTIKTTTLPITTDTKTSPITTDTTLLPTTMELMSRGSSPEYTSITETSTEYMTTPSIAGSTMESSTTELIPSVHTTDVTIPTTPSTTTTTTLSFLCQAMMNAVCPPILNMHCGNDNRTYQNPCEVTKAQCVQPGLMMSYDGPCVSTKVDCTADVTVVLSVICPDVQDPFCGSDGNTYENICQFRKAKCFLSTLEIASVGSCKERKH